MAAPTTSSMPCWCILGRHYFHTTSRSFAGQQVVQDERPDGHEDVAAASACAATFHAFLLPAWRKEHAADKDSALNLENHGTMLYEGYAGFSVSTDFLGLEGF